MGAARSPNLPFWCVFSALAAQLSLNGQPVSKLNNWWRSGCSSYLIVGTAGIGTSKMLRNISRTSRAILSFGERGAELLLSRLILYLVSQLRRQRIHRGFQRIRQAWSRTRRTAPRIHCSSRTWLGKSLHRDRNARQMWKGGVGHCKVRLLISSLRHLQVSGDFLRPTVLCWELLGNRQIGTAQRHGSKAQDDKAVLKRLEQTSQTPSGSTFAFAVNPGCMPEKHSGCSWSLWRCFKGPSPSLALLQALTREEANQTLEVLRLRPSKDIYTIPEHARACQSSMKAFTEDLLVLDLQVQTGYSQATYFADEALHFWKLLSKNLFFCCINFTRWLNIFLQAWKPLKKHLQNWKIWYCTSYYVYIVYRICIYI